MERLAYPILRQVCVACGACPLAAASQAASGAQLWLWGTCCCARIIRIAAHGWVGGELWPPPIPIPTWQRDSTSMRDLVLNASSSADCWLCGRPSGVRRKQYHLFRLEAPRGIHERSMLQDSHGKIRGGRHTIHLTFNNHRLCNLFRDYN